MSFFATFKAVDMPAFAVNILIYARTLHNSVASRARASIKKDLILNEISILLFLVHIVNCFSVCILLDE